MRKDTLYFETPGHRQLQVHRLPKDCIIFNPAKTYPLCNCGRLFVPIHKGDQHCFFCLFLAP
jgi:hypothetical protein